MICNTSLLVVIFAPEYADHFSLVTYYTNIMLYMSHALTSVLFCIYDDVTRSEETQQTHIT